MHGHGTSATLAKVWPGSQTDIDGAVMRDLLLLAALGFSVGWFGRVITWRRGRNAR